MQASKKREIRIKADAFREKCRVGRYGIIDLFKECERTGFKLIRYPLGENADLGFTMKKDMDIIIFTNSSVRMSREIFTLAHEIGHVILHMEDVFEYIDDKNTVSNKNSNEKEEEANYFAACLLMPEDNVEKFLDLELNDFKNNGLTAMDIARIMSEFKVSFDMALNRLENLNKINANDRINLDNIRNEKRVGNLLRSVGGNARLNSPSNDIDIPHEYLDYVIYNYNHNAIPKETLERVLDCCKLTIEDVSDRIVVHTEENDDLGELIRGLED
jgi:Zn-dependent peptidase ImmA (M78 family)